MSAIYDSNSSKDLKEEELLRRGWKPLHRSLDLGHLYQLIEREPITFLQKTLDIGGVLANTLGRSTHTWWANLLGVFTGEVYEKLEAYMNGITPRPEEPPNYYQEISALHPVGDIQSDDSAMSHALMELREHIVLSILETLGTPSSIIERNGGKYLYYPVEHFTNWGKGKIVSIDRVLAYWDGPGIWLEIKGCNSFLDQIRGRREYTLLGAYLKPLIARACQGIAIMVSGHNTQVGQLDIGYPLHSFPQPLPRYAREVEAVLETKDKVAILIQGVPGTGKTTWCHSLAHALLIPRGYTIFILDHQALESFIPPKYLEKICIIINEADNLAHDRGTAASQGGRTERILSLLDGSVYQSIIQGSKNQQSLVILMTCNTIERLDPAFLRTGRVDLHYQFDKVLI